MATTERDYYELLGVSRDASEAEIKRAFRKRARELHPDVSDEPEAEQRFREVAEAYEVLSDSGRRATYDRFGHAGLRRGGFEPTFADFGSIADIFASFFGDDLFGGRPAQTRSGQGGDVHATVQIDLEDAFTGTSASVSVDVAIGCTHCGASGSEPGTGVGPCPTCGGAGVTQRSCPECGGTGQVLESPCRECHGEGRVLVDRTLDVDVPAGIHDGQRLRLRGEGHAGFRGGKRGDAYVAVRVRSDPRFVRDGDDLHTALRVTMLDAALGTTVRVPALGGELELEVPAGTQPGAVRVLRCHGMPALHGSRRGDLYVRLDVAVPTRLTEEQRQALATLGREIGEDAYAAQDERDDEGFFRRLKSALR
jgi:molecular chaperone DnaJ